MICKFEKINQEKEAYIDEIVRLEKSEDSFDREKGKALRKSLMVGEMIRQKIKKENGF